MTSTKLVVGILLLLLTPSFAQSNNNTSSSSSIDILKPIVDGLNSSWMLICAFLVFFMQAGFAILGILFTIHYYKIIITIIIVSLIF